MKTLSLACLCHIMGDYTAHCPKCASNACLEPLAANKKRYLEFRELFGVPQGRVIHGVYEGPKEHKRGLDRERWERKKVPR